MQIGFVVRATVVALAMASAAALTRGDARAVGRNPRLSALPPVMFWAWHRPEDLRGLDPRRAGVAYLAATWILTADGPQIERRRQPLRVDPGTPLLAVVRIESRATPLAPLAFDATEIHDMARSLSEIVGQSSAMGLQIDFDAKASEHVFYRALLAETRAALGDRLLSMTALVSWCLGDEPLLTAPIDEAVPMLFQLGVPNASHLKEVGAAGNLRARACAHAVGVSLDERTPALEGGRRLYIFSPKSWTPESATRALAEVPKWR